MTIHKFNITDGDPNTDTSKVNQTQPAPTFNGSGPSAAERAEQGMKRYAAYRAENGLAVDLAEKKAREAEEAQKQRQAEFKAQRAQSIY